MTKTKQLDKNIELSDKLAKFIIKHPQALRDIPDDASLIFFSASDQTLNKANEQLLASLKKSKQPIVRAQETGNKDAPWIFTPVL